MSTKAPGEILELFRGGYLSMAETIDALDAVEGYVSVELLNIERAISDDLREQNAKLREAAAVGGEATDDLRTHRESWRRALELARAMAAPSGVDHDDAVYWDHEIAAFDRAFAATPAVGGEINETSRDWDICRAVDLYRADRNKGDERTLADFLNEIGLVIAAPPASPLRERDSVLIKWQEKLADLRDMKARGDLTRDWGECSLINAQNIVDDLTASGASPEQSAARCYCHVLPNGYGKCPVCRASEQPASPPEQPAAGCGDPRCNDPDCTYGKGTNYLAQPAAEMFRCNCPHEVRSGCSEPRCAHYTPPQSAAAPFQPHENCSCLMCIAERPRDEP